MPFDLSQLDETIAYAVFEAFVQEKTPSEICDEILKKFGRQLSQKHPMSIIRKAVELHWIQFHSAQQNPLSQALREKYTTLKVADVADVAFTQEIVARRAAGVVFDVLRESHGVADFRIGFSGGQTIRRVVQNLVELLRRPGNELPKRITCYSLVGGFDPEHPGTDPTSFLAYLDDPVIKDVGLDVHFVLLHVPPIISSEQEAKLFELKELQKARKDVNFKLDLVITSAASAMDEHSQFRIYFEKYAAKTMQTLVEQGYIGDVLWQPISINGPIDTAQHTFRTVSLLALNDFPERIAARAEKVLFVAGPCPDCTALKSPVIKALLDLSRAGGPQYVTHLVMDPKTARAVLDAALPAKA